jgi:hypothetical protein
MGMFDKIAGAFARAKKALTSSFTAAAAPALAATVLTIAAPENAEAADLYLQGTVISVDDSYGNFGVGYALGTPVQAHIYLPESGTPDSFGGSVIGFYQGLPATASMQFDSSGADIYTNLDTFANEVIRNADDYDGIQLSLQGVSISGWGEPDENNGPFNLLFFGGTGSPYNLNEDTLDQNTSAHLLSGGWGGRFESTRIVDGQEQTSILRFSFPSVSVEPFPPFEPEMGVPEPSTYAAGAALVGMVAYSVHRGRRSQRSEPSSDVNAPRPNTLA